MLNIPIGYVAIQHARERYVNRLNRFGHTEKPCIYHTKDRFAAAQDRSSFLSSVADVFVASSSIKGLKQNHVLKAACAYFGYPNWDTLSAVLPRQVSTPDSTVELRQRGFTWTGTGGMLVMGGSPDHDAHGWCWTRLESERYSSRVLNN